MQEVVDGLNQIKAEIERRCSPQEAARYESRLRRVMAQVDAARQHVMEASE
ncbi:Hypothetical protein CAP_1402 [Chondromyces apiculatus DSM 436]|uniref:Uncharacterized protein n=1 Tax=Chondromyces apiculatus DSM 436 TaxID=1192034 RepID=A0A017SU18_9BACT|nr:Hypothetical protein CAP_1402 [Chondromyces apiculatus DSM 436]